MPRILDVVEYPDATGKEIVRRVPERGAGDFRLCSQLIVRESQVAVFYRDGKALDTFAPGRHTLTTANLPLLSRLVNLVFSGDTPFTAEVYFVNTRDFIDMRWGTPEPITLRDGVLRMIRIRAHGTYDMAVADAPLFVNQIVGARGFYTTRDITSYLRSMVINRLTDLLGENVTSILDLPAMFDEIAAAARVRLRDDFAALGLALKRLYIMSISPTEETSKAIDEAASMGALGDMDRYVKFKSARAIGDAATAGGMAAATTQTGLGLGTGIAAAKAIADSFSQPSAPAQPAPSKAQPETAAAPADPVEALSTLKRLLDAGLVSQEEYDTKKAEILSRL